MKPRISNPAGGADRPVYFISDRPEAYEYWGEMSHDDAKALADIIAGHAARHFPNIEFRIDGDWHTHDPALGFVASYIDGHSQAWAAEMAKRRQSG